MSAITKFESRLEMGIQDQTTPKIQIPEFTGSLIG
jgi:hypothetical protein